MWEWLVFLAIMAVGQFSPGPDMLLLTRTALSQGRSAGCWTALGIACGLAIHAVVALIGVASLMAQGGWLEMLLRWLAAAYMLWLGYQLIRGALKTTELSVTGSSEGFGANGFSSWKRGLLCNLLNPKVAVFLGGVTAPFLLNREGWAWPVLLWVTIVLGGLILWCLWVCLLQQPSIKKMYQRMARWIDLVFGLALWGLALALIGGAFSAKFAV